MLLLPKIKVSGNQGLVLHNFPLRDPIPVRKKCRTLPELSPTFRIRAYLCRLPEMSGLSYLVFQIQS